MRYHAASTGRWGGQGIQPHNYPRKCPKDRKGLDEPGEAMERACQRVLTGDYELMCMLYGRDNIMSLLSSVLRGTITAAPGHELLASDYSSIEARGTFWVSGHTEGLEVFRRIDAGEMPGQDIYTWQASKIHGRTIYKEDDQERQDGKVVVLGCGYQMGGPKLSSYAAKMGVEISEERGAELVAAYRETNWPVKNFWYDQQKAAIAAVRKPGRVVRHGRISWKVHGRFLHCRLPSGRLLSYFDPRVEIVETDWGKRPQIQFWGVDTNTRQWCLTSTYGGKLTENIVQALCRDIMAEAMIRVEAAGYPIILTVHDEIISEVRKGFGSLEEFNALLSQRPKWADGFPITADGWRSKRYRK
jgi:DNA polymerase